MVDDMMMDSGTDSPNSDLGFDRVVKALAVAGDNLNIALAVFDDQRRMAYANAQWEQFTGVGFDALKGRVVLDEYYDSIDEEYRGLALELPDRLLRGENISCEIDGRQPDGSHRSLLVFAKALWSDTGRYFGAVSTLIDITERKQAERSLREAESNLQAMFNAISDGVYLYSADSSLMAVNQAGAERFGMQPHDMIGRNMQEFHSAVPEKHTEDWKELVERGRPFRFVSKHGRNTYENSHQPVFDASGKVDRVAVYSRDITDQNLAREAVRKILIGLEVRAVENAQELDQALSALRRKEDELQALLNNIPDMAWLKDEDCRFLLVNEAFEAFCGFPTAWIKGKTDLDLWPRDLARKYMADDRRVMADGYPIRIDEPLQSWDGTRYIIETIKRPIRDELGRTIGTVGISRDVTERRRTEDELLVHRNRLEAQVAFRTKELERNVEALEQEVAERRRIEAGLVNLRMQLQAMAAQIAMAEEQERRRIALELHDRLGQTLSLAKIRLDTHMAKSEFKGCRDALDEVSDYIGMAIEAARSLIFDLSPPVLYDMGLEAAIDWLGESLLEKHGIALRLDIFGEAENVSMELKTTFFRAVRELLVNAVKHSGASRVDINIFKDMNSIRITVSDNGIGGVTGDFVKMDGGRMRFGLFNIRERMMHLGGSMEVDSVPMAGTTIILALPLNAGEGLGVDHE